MSVICSSNAKQQLWNFEHEILVFHLQHCLQNVMSVCAPHIFRPSDSPGITARDLARSAPAVLVFGNRCFIYGS